MSESSGGRTPKGRQQDVLDADNECISVDAGAGSGKTTTMRWRIEELLTAVDAPPSDRVLVLTFANEAAASIQESITDKAQLAIDQAYNVDVHTYHSFCSRLVSEYAYVLGLDPDFDVITDDQRFRLIQRLIDENEYRYVSRRQNDIDAVKRQAVKYIQEMRQEAVTPAAVEEFLPTQSTVGELNELVIALEQSAAQEFDPDDLVNWDDFEANATRIGASLDAYRDTITRWQHVADHRSGGTWSMVESYLVFLSSWADSVEALVEEDPSVAYGFLPQALFHDSINTDWWTDLKQTPFGHLKSYVNVLEELHGLQEIYQDYVAELESRGALDFDELIYKADSLINDSHVSDEICNRWDYVFCDEFQDTDDTQIDVVTGLCQNDSQLLAIGDVDQAIYGWRGANPEGLNDLSDAFTDHNRIDIKRNFRSEQEILELTNQCGAYDSKHLVSDDCDAERPGGEPCVEREEDDEARLGIVSGDWTELTTAQEVATTISQLLEDGLTDIEERTLGDIAVIVRTNRQVRDVAASLRTRQIPYRIDGASETTLQPGVQTILSYFRVLANPAADIHLRRVLVLVYRVSETDLNELEMASEDSLYEAVMKYDDIDGLSIDDNDRLDRARGDITDLSELKDSHSLPYFYNAFLDKTRIQWYLQEEDRANLDRIMKFIQAYESDTVLRRFSEGFVDSLARSLKRREDDQAVSIGSRSEDNVNIMTVHQAKGLQFDTVLFPYLEDAEWASTSTPPWALTSDAVWSAHRYTTVIRSIKEDTYIHPLVESVYQDRQAEGWRTFHVGVTRAESLLIVFSQSSEEYDDWQKSVSELRRQFIRASGPANSPEQLLEAEFPDLDTPWSPEHPRMELWNHVRDSFKAVEDRYPDTVVNMSDEVAQAANVTPGTITYYNEYDDELNLQQAIEEVHELGQDIFEENLTPHDPTSHDIYPSSLRFDDGAELPVQHSHTSLETYSDCPRRHLLDHVLYGFDDPMPANTAVGRSDEPSWRNVGNVFHAVAEEAFYRDETAYDEWLRICDRIIRARDLESVRDEVEACIHRIFSTNLLDWEPVGAELEFEMTDIPGVNGPVIGYIDSVRRVPGKGLTVLDYKTTFEKRDPHSSSQLLLYLRACERLFDESVDWAGYLYVGEAGGADGEIDLIHREDIEDSWTDVVDLLQAADSPSWDANPGSHCRHCPHRSLGCAPEEHEYDNELVIETDD